MKTTAIHEPSSDQLELLGMFRVPDHATSIKAAVELLPHLNELHSKVVDAFREFGKLTDGEIENLPQFVGYGPSTIRKRRSELFQRGILVDTGETKMNERNKSMIVWALKR